MIVPTAPRIYHIVHVDRLSSITTDGELWCDAEIARRNCSGTVIGIGEIKQRRLSLPLRSRPGLRVGDCVPFYFCPRSVMLFVIAKGNHPRLDYKCGQEPIVHLVADLHATVAWAERQDRRWAFTLSNAGSGYFEDRSDLSQLDEIDWQAIETRQWQSCKDEKQAEFLIEHSFLWSLVLKIGVYSPTVKERVERILQNAPHRPSVRVLRKWYY